MLLKKLTLLYKNLILIIIVGLTAFFLNFHYGFIGIMPMDNTVLYNGGYRVLNGYVPFNDYWLVTGPLLDYLNAGFFHVLGISWSTFIIHSSIFNLILAISSYYLFIDLKLSKIFSAFYSILISLLFYPVVGTPFVDHHSTFFLLIAFYLFIIFINRKNFVYLIFIPISLCLSFLSKQTPAVYGALGILILLFFACFFYKKKTKKIILNLIYGGLISIALLFLFFSATKIDINNFFLQYLAFAGSIGEYRLQNYNFEILGFISEYKFINFFIIILLFTLFFFMKKKNFKSEDILIIFTSILLSIILVFHQFLTLNQNYIFFLIPYLCAVTQIFYEKFFKNNYLKIIFISICIFSVSKYHLRFNEERKFNELSKVDISKAVDASLLSSQLTGLKWITHRYPNNPTLEIKNLQEVIKTLKTDNSDKILITNYQFLPVILNDYDYSPNQWHHPSVSFPLKNNKYFKDYKNFFIKNIQKNNIVTIYETNEKNNSITELVLDSECIKKKRAGEMLIKIELVKNCNDLN